MKQMIELVDTPAELVKLAAELMDLTSGAESVVFGAHLAVTGGCIGTYCPEIRSIYIDLGNALNEQALYNNGMMFIPNVWCALIWALGHEIEHACQLELEPQLIEYATLPQEYEDIATEAGATLVLDWSKDHKMPGLRELGWLGKQLIVMLNAMYTKYPDIADEATNAALGAAAPLDTVFAKHEFTDRGKEVLIEDIDAGKIGVKVGNNRFLTTYEFFGL